MEMDYEKRISKREEMGEVSDNATQEESRKLMTKLVDSKEQKATNCSPDCERFGGGCVDYECVLCKEGRFGMDCAMSKKDLDSARLTAPTAWLCPTTRSCDKDSNVDNFWRSSRIKLVNGMLVQRETTSVIS